LVAVLGGAEGHTKRIYSVAVSPDGKTLASAGDDKAIKLWDLATAKLLHTLTGQQGEVHAPIAFSPDGKTLASTARANPGRLWDPTADPPQEKMVLRGHGDHVSSVAFSPDGKLLATSSPDGSVKVWDAGTGKNLRTLWGHEQGTAAHVTGRLNNVFDV